MAHGNTCHLGPGMRWDECLCADIDPSDRPCLTCVAVAASGVECLDCREQAEARALYRENLARRAAGEDVLTLSNVLPFRRRDPER